MATHRRPGVRHPPFSTRPGVCREALLPRRGWGPSLAETRATRPGSTDGRGTGAGARDGPPGSQAGDAGRGREVGAGLWLP